MKKFLVFLSLVVLSFSFPNISQATLMGPTYPAPGLNGLSASGSGLGKSGGVTYSFSGFDSNAYENLYWGQWATSTIGASLDGGSPLTGLENMSFNLGQSSFPNGWAVWTGQSSWTYKQFIYSSFITAPISTRLTIKVTDSSSNPVTLIAPNTVGGPSVGALAPVLGNFNANLCLRHFFQLRTVRVQHGYLLMMDLIALIHQILPTKHFQEAFTTQKKHPSPTPLSCSFSVPV